MTIKLLCKDVDVDVGIDLLRITALCHVTPPKRFSHDDIVACTEVNNACDRLAQPPQPHNVFLSTEEVL